MDLPNGRGDAPTPNGGGGGAEELEAAAVRRKKAQAQLVREAIHDILEEKRKDNGHGEENGLPAGQLQEEEGLLSSLLTKLDAVEADPDSGISEEQPHSSQPGRGESSGGKEDEKSVELAAIARDLGKIKRQNTVTHLLLGAVIVLTAVWQVNEVSFLLWVQRKLSNPFKSLGDQIKASLKMKGRKPVTIESSPLPPVGVPEVGRGDLPSLIIGSSEDMD